MEGREMVRLTTFALAAALSIGNVLAAETPRVGEWGAVKYGFGALSVACPTTADISRYHQLRNSAAIAAETFSAQHCTTLDGGTEVMVEHDSAVWSGTMCVRPRGATDCLWIRSIAIENKADADAQAAAQKKSDDDEAASVAKLKAFNDDFNARFDKEHPECKGWKTNTHLPEHCY